MRSVPGVSRRLLRNLLNQRARLLRDLLNQRARLLRNLLNQRARLLGNLLNQGAVRPYSRRVGVWNTFVEGDNLEVLLTLGGRVDLIYIDPPYNTGNAFAYRDDYRGGEWVEMM